MIDPEKKDILWKNTNANVVARNEGGVLCINTQLFIYDSLATIVHMCFVVPVLTHIS